MGRWEVAEPLSVTCRAPVSVWNRLWKDWKFCPAEATVVRGDLWNMELVLLTTPSIHPLSLLSQNYVEWLRPLSFLKLHPEERLH